MDEELPELFQMFEPIERFSKRYDRGTLDLERPTTEIAKLKKALHVAAKQVDGERLVGELGGFLQSLPRFDVKAVLSRPRPPGARVGLLCDYLDDIDRQVPMLTTMVYGGSLLPTLEFLEHCITAEARLRAAAQSRGETRSERLRSLAELLEVLYREMVTVLYELECVRQRRQLCRGLELGNLIQAVAAWTRDSLPGFVDCDAARIRNAAAHYHWRYDPHTQVVHIHNQRQGLVTWEARFKMSELYRRLRDMVFAVVDFSAAVIWRAAEAFFEMLREPPLSRIFEPGVLAGPPPELEEQNRRALAERYEQVHVHLAAAHWTSRRAERDAAELATQTVSAADSASAIPSQTAAD